MYEEKESFPVGLSYIIIGAYYLWISTIKSEYNFSFFLYFIKLLQLLYIPIVLYNLRDSEHGNLFSNELCLVGRGVRVDPAPKSRLTTHDH